MPSSGLAFNSFRRRAVSSSVPTRMNLRCNLRAGEFAFQSQPHHFLLRKNQHETDDAEQHRDRPGEFEAEKKEHHDQTRRREQAAFE